MKKIWNYTTGLALSILIILVAVMYVPMIFKIEPLIVLSGSMEPNYPIGSMVFVKPVSSDEIEVGDTITFYVNDETLVTHRVASIDEENKCYVTKGDANETVDASTVRFSSVIGKPIICIPKIGFFADKINHKSGKILYITAIICLVILMYIGDLIWGEESEKGKKKCLRPQKS